LRSLGNGATGSAFLEDGALCAIMGANM
jgi:hypothetical protein